MKNLTKGNPLKLILLFAFPLFVGQMFQLFYSLVDTRIIGETLSETSLAAVGATTPLSDLLTGFLNGITNGFAIVIATFYGADDRVNMRKAVAGTALLSILMTLSVSLLCLAFLPQLLSVLHVSPTLLPQSESYIRIILAGLTAATLYNICAAILRAVGDSFTPLIFLVFSALCNIGLDYCFILFLHWGVAGAAAATVISQAASALLCFLYMRKKYPFLFQSIFSPDRAILGKLLPTGLSMGFMVSLVNLGTLALQTSINTFDTNIIVAHTAARKATSLFMLPFSAFGTTLATYCGQNLGAGEYGRIRQGIRDALLLTFGWCALVILTTFTAAPRLIRLITASDQTEILDTASLYLRVNTSFYFIPAMICLFRNSMQGFGDSKTPVFSSSLELIGKLLIALFLAPAIGYMGIIVSEPIVWIVMVIPLIVNMARNPIFSGKTGKGQ